jgi:hypothetical protein
MNWKIGFILCFCGISFGISAQNLEQTLGLADKMAESGNWDGALYYYERVLFFGEESITSLTWEKVANVHRALDHQEDVIDCLDAAFFTAESEERKEELVLKKAFYLLSVGRFYEGIAELKVLSDQQLDAEQLRRKNFLLAVGYLGAEDFQTSERWFLALTDSTEFTKREQIQELFANIKLRNPKTARTLSTIVPGAGQLYAGDGKAALNSLGLIGAFVGLGVLSSLEYSLLQSTWALPWVWRYYQGGILEAGRATRRRNAHLKKKLYLQLNSLLFEAGEIDFQPAWE